METLIAALVEELTDPEFSTRKHYSRSTYKDGCQGPLCQKSERDRMRRKRQRLNPDRKVRVKPLEVMEKDHYLDMVIDALGLRHFDEAESLAG